MLVGLAVLLGLAALSGYYVAVIRPNLSLSLSDSVPVAITRAKLIGPHDPHAPLVFSFSLQPQHQAAIDALAHAVYDPNSPQYQHFLPTGAFAARFGPSADQLAALHGFMQQAGLQALPSTDPFLIQATATSGSVEAAFHTRINDYEFADGTTFFANAQSIQIPERIADVVQDVVGLNDVPLVSPAVATTPASPHFGGGPRGGLIPQQVAGIYDATPVYTQLHDQGQDVTVGLFELSEYTPADIDTFMQQYVPNHAPIVLDASKPTGNSLFGHAGAAEVELDIEMVLALAPQITKIIVYEPSLLAQGLPVLFGNSVVEEYRRIATENAADVVSTSIGDCEPAYSTIQRDLNSVFEQMALQDQTMIAASGDTGVFGCLGRPFDPTSDLQVGAIAAQPYVTGVGGTSLATAFSSSVPDQPAYPVGPDQQETVWNDNCTAQTCSNGGPGTGSGSGGGVSRVWPRPSYQAGTGVHAADSKSGSWCGQASGTACREVPDVALNADGNSGYAIYCSDTGDRSATTATGTKVSGCSGWMVAGGTSAAAPLWAAIAALMDTQARHRLGFLNPLLYSCSGRSGTDVRFHDIVQGNNGAYQARPGYDMATGLGTPDIYQLVQHPSCSLPSPTSAPQTTASPTPSLSQLTVYVGASDGSLRALDASDGTPRWSFRPPSTQSSTFAVAQASANGVVYVEYLGAIGSGEVAAPLYAVNASSGSLLWQWTPPPPPNLGATEESGPPSFVEVTGNVVFVSAYNLLIALDAQTGRPRWQYDATDWNWSLADDGRAVFVSHGSAAGTTSLDALDLQTGNPLWHATVRGSPQGLALAQGVVYVGICPSGERQVPCSTSQVVYAYDTSTRAALWHANVGTGAGLDLQVMDGRVFASPYVAGVGFSHVTTLDARTGAVLPSAPATCANEGVVAEGASGYQPCVDAAGNAQVIAYSLASGQQLWAQTSLGAGGHTVLDIADVTGGTVYVNESNFGGAESGNQNFFTAYALDAHSGAIRWTHEGAIQDIAAGIAVLTTPDGACIAINTSDGSQRWSFDTGASSQGFVETALLGP